MTKPRLMTTAEVADVLQVSVRTVARYVERGRLHPTTQLPGLRGAYLFSPREVERLMQGRAA